MPTDRHTATGTCEIGPVRNKPFSRRVKIFWPSRPSTPLDWERGPPFAADGAAGARDRDAGSAFVHERLDALGVANERDHHRDAEQEEDALQDMNAVRSELEQIGD